MTVQEYKSLLTAQLTSLAAARPDEEIETGYRIFFDRMFADETITDM